MKWHTDMVKSVLHLPKERRKEWDKMTFDSLMKKFHAMVIKRNAGKGLKEDKKGNQRVCISADYIPEPIWYWDNM